MMNFYSQADQKDNLRYACVQALEYLVPQIAMVLKTDTSIFLTFMNCFVTLVTDEYAEIRLFASTLVKPDSSSMTYNDNMSLVILFKMIFDLLGASDKKDTPEFQAKVKEFIFLNISNAKFEKYKSLSAYNTRIFAFDKPNKYREDAKVIKAMYKSLNSSPLDIKFTREEYDLYLEKEGVIQPQDYTKELDIYFSNVFMRNEMIFSKGLQTFAISQLIGDEDTVPVLKKDYFAQFFA